MRTFFKVVPVRLYGADKSELRTQCLDRDKDVCQECSRKVFRHLPDWHPMKADMAHIIGLGAGGSDTLENVRTECHECHMRDHNGGKPCPKKPWNA